MGRLKVTGTAFTKNTPEDCLNCTKSKCGDCAVRAQLEKEKK